MYIYKCSIICLPQLYQESLLCFVCSFTNEPIFDYTSYGIDSNLIFNFFWKCEVVARDYLQLTLCFTSMLSVSPLRIKISKKKAWQFFFPKNKMKYYILLLIVINSIHISMKYTESWSISVLPPYFLLWLPSHSLPWWVAYVSFSILESVCFAWAEYT